jgi:hypothetical protein
MSNAMPTPEEQTPPADAEPYRHPGEPKPPKREPTYEECTRPFELYHCSLTGNTPSKREDADGEPIDESPEDLLLFFNYDYQ